MAGKTESSKRMDRYEGAMLGVAVGDALGAPLEFMGVDAIRRKYGEPVREMVGGGWLSVEPGEVTDDTQMTLAVAEGIAATGGNGAMFRIGQNFLRWYGTNPKDVGGTCAAVLEEMSHAERQDGDEWILAAHRLHASTGGQTAGNGALMRTIYPILWEIDEERAASTSAMIAKMTHWHRMIETTTRRYARAVWRFANSEISPEEARRELEMARSNPEEKPKPSGYCLDSLACAIDSVIRTESFEDALVDAVNRGGDADTIGAITGGLAGAIYGAGAIPTRWINALDNGPNRRTVRLFHDEGETGNVLAIRLVELAHAACDRR